MKKKLLGLTLGAMGLVLVACTPQKNDVKEAESGGNDIEVIELETADDEVYEGMNTINPWVDSDKEGVLEATGFNFVAPAEAANVAYSYMPSTGMAQMNYTQDYSMWVYRAQKTDVLEDISGMYYDWNLIEETKVAGMDAVEYSYSLGGTDGFIDTEEATRVINWYDAENKVTYSLSVIGNDLNGLDTAVYAENLYKLAD